MHWVSAHVVAPLRHFQSELCSHAGFSVAELLMALVLIWLLYRIAFRKWKGFLTGIITLALFVYAGFCFLWGTYYYGEKPLEADPISTEQLETVTRYFADLANDTCRDEPDRKIILEKSSDIYGDGIKAKGIICSKVMSYLDFTGFFFPFTGEANVNMDCPAHDLAATAAHELAHLHGIATEQDANFTAVVNCLEYGDPDYVYSASLMAYTYLGNALYSADRTAWQEVYSGLSDGVKADLGETSSYWAKYQTKVKEVSNTVYENFLYSYDQDLGLKSYGACVDLLVNYYYDSLKNS